MGSAALAVLGAAVGLAVEPQAAAGVLEEHDARHAAAAEQGLAVVAGSGSLDGLGDGEPPDPLVDGPAEGVGEGPAAGASGRPALVVRLASVIGDPFCALMGMDQARPAAATAGRVACTARSARSFSRSMPPQMPYRSPRARAPSRHSSRTGQASQSTRACLTRRPRSLGDSRSGPKNRPGSASVHAGSAGRSHTGGGAASRMLARASVSPVMVLPASRARRCACLTRARLAASPSGGFTAQAEERRRAGAGQQAQRRARRPARPSLAKRWPGQASGSPHRGRYGTCPPSRVTLNADPGLFFGPERESPKIRGRRVKQARVLCATPARSGTSALTAPGRGERYGIWGGIDLENERALRAVQATRPAVAAAGRA